jgi:hypothetical protein
MMSRPQHPDSQRNPNAQIPQNAFFGRLIMQNFFAIDAREARKAYVSGNKLNVRH